MCSKTVVAATFIFLVQLRTQEDPNPTERTMSFAGWLHLLTSAEKTSIISGGFRKIHYSLPDGREMAEEYSMATGVITRRAWRAKSVLKGPSVEWTVELGDVVRQLNPSADTFVLKESLTEVSSQLLSIDLQTKLYLLFSQFYRNASQNAASNGESETFPTRFKPTPSRRLIPIPKTATTLWSAPPIRNSTKSSMSSSCSDAKRFRMPI